MNQLPAIPVPPLAVVERTVLPLCLRYAQAVAPEWPIAILWMFFRLSFANSLARVLRSKVCPTVS
jgi:hypothetical protein